jgi:glyoxylase-like metal-dependent hydrolase (beta-lactamase superfamily II)
MCDTYPAPVPATFTVHEVAAGVWACVAPGPASAAVSNAAIVDLGDKTVVVDTFMTLLAAEDLADEVHRRTGREPFLVVNSHWHSDHVRGNAAFATTPTVGTARMLQLIVEDAPRSPQEFAERAEQVRQSATALAAAATTDEEQRTARGTKALADALAAEVGSYRIALPDILIGDRLDIDGERSLTILGYGRGHTESDLLVHVPDAGVVVAGDLVWTGTHPKTSDGFPAEWAAVLDRVGELKPAAVVSGHGPPGGPDDVAAMADYMRKLEAMVAAATAGDLDPATADPPQGFEAWGGLGRFRTGLDLLARRGEA